MSCQEKEIFIEKLRNAVESYQGFTQTEKCYAQKHLPEWIGKEGELDTFIQKFSERSLDIKPFLNEIELITQKVA
ncbi:hypothetical protein MNB_SV-13-1332 [hydrothermal vent metagenome]|uniref:Uncharacterized protein n=1 Tax=hydrothermal vent metagenome TaxID=652676 RepID=A0A1W1CXX1_9ZZZZ